MNKLVPLMAAAAALLATPALAQEGPGLYGSVGYSHVTTDEVDLGAITGRFGAKFLPNLGVEGEASFGIGEETVDFGGTDLDVSIENDFGAYVVGFIPASENVELFARLGYGTATVEGSAGGVSAEYDAQGIRAGAGVQFFFDGVNGVRGEYTRYDGDEIEADVFGISYVRRFR